MAIILRLDRVMADRKISLKELSEKDRAFLWAYGLMDVGDFFDVLLSWGDEISYPGQ